MSFPAIMQAFNLPDNIKGNGRLVAIALANRVNMHPEHDNQLCAWPSIKGIAADIGASKSAVKNSLNMLEERGVITRIQRFSDKGQINTLYMWHPWRAEGWDEARMQRREAAERGYPTVPPQAPQEHQGQHAEPEPTPAPTPTEKPTQKPADGFDQWWPIYPKKVKKLDAQKAYRAALKAGATPQDLIDGLRKHITNWKAKGTAPQYIPYPATWLRAGSWEDELDALTPGASQVAPAINPNTGKAVTKEDFWYACKDHGIDPRPYVNFWKPSMGVPGDPGWGESQAYLDRHTGRA